MTYHPVTVTDYYTGKVYVDLPTRTVWSDGIGVYVVNPYTVESFRVRESEQDVRAMMAGA